MNLNNTPQNQSYWFVLRDDQSSVLLNSNNFPVQNTHIVGGSTRYVVDTSGNQYIQLGDPQPEVSAEEPTIQPTEPASQPKETIFWNRNKIKLLLNLTTDEKFKNFNVKDGDALKHKVMWKEIAPLVGTSSEECCKKYLTLKNTYVRLYRNKQQGKDTKWAYYSMCEEAFKRMKLLAPDMMDSWDDSKIRMLLTMYIEKTRNVHIDSSTKKQIWQEIGAEIGTSEYKTHLKFRCLKRTYLRILEKSRLSGKIIKWPYLMYFQQIFSGKDLRQWDRNKVTQLLDAVVERAHLFANPSYQKKELWREISAVVGETYLDCDKKFRNLKHTYGKLKKMEQNGQKLTKWKYFEQFELIKDHTLIASTDETPADIDEKFFTRKYKEEGYVKQLLNFYIQHKEEFKNPLIRKKQLWKTIGSKLNMSYEDCHKKFRNLKQTYIRVMDHKARSGKNNNWPYFSYFEKIYDEDIPRGHVNASSADIEDMMLTEFNKVVYNADKRRENDYKFERLIEAVAESNNIQKERNRILQALLDRQK